MYARTRGKSGSKKPISKKPPSWVDYKKSEVDALVLKLRKQGHESAMIGTILRDEYGIPSVKNITGKKITKILKENNSYTKFPEDLLNLLKKVVKLDEHLKENKKDVHSKRGMELTESKIRRLVKYYKKRKVLPEDWKYKRENVKLIVE